ncbi:ribonuclease H-like domain-containing protein [Tanacetum coccineum]
MSNEPYDEGSNPRSEVNAESVEKPASAEGSTDLNAEPKSGHAVAKDFASHPASTSGKTVIEYNNMDSIQNSDSLGSIIADDISVQVDATSDDENYDSEGEEFSKFDLLFGSYEGDLERVVVDESVRRSNRKTSLPSKLKDYEIQGKVSLRVLLGTGVGVLRAIFIGSCLLFLEKYNNAVLTKSSAEAEYRAMSNVACEIIWILKILTYLKVEYTILMQMFCDSSATMQIAANPIFHERT